MFLIRLHPYLLLLFRKISNLSRIQIAYKRLTNNSLRNHCLNPLPGRQLIVDQIGFYSYISLALIINRTSMAIIAFIVSHLSRRTHLIVCVYIFQVHEIKHLLTVLWSSMTRYSRADRLKVCTLWVLNHWHIKPPCL